MSKEIAIQKQPSNSSGQASGLDAYTLNPKQQLVLHEKNWSNEILFGGAKFGGKSFLMRYVFSLLCLNCPGILCYLFRRTHEDLRKNHMEGPSAFPSMLAPYVEEGRCAIVKNEVRWANGARIFLNHLHLQKHVMKYQGQDIHALGIDEATQFEESQIRYLFGSVRLAKWGEIVRPQILANASLSEMIRNLVERLPLILMSANPGGVSHHFIKERFIDQGPYVIKVSGAFRRQFIPARVEDNADMLKTDPNYIARLEEMGDAVLVQAMLEGNWEIVAGSMFGDVFRKHIGGKPWHVCDPFTIPATWEIWRGGDDGYSAPSAIYWLTRNPDTGTIYVIREIYQTGLLPEDLARKILEIDMSVMLDYGNGDYDTNDEELTGVMDSAAFSDIGVGKASRGSQMNALGCRWTPIVKERDKVNDKGFRVMRCQLMHKMLMPNPHDPNKEPGIRFFSNCANAIKTIPALLRDEKNPEDVNPEGETHAFDAITYGAARRKKAFTRPKVSV